MTTTDDNEVKANQDIKDINSSGQVMTTIDHSEVISNQDIKEISSSGPDLTTTDNIEVKTKKNMKEILSSVPDLTTTDDIEVKTKKDMKEISSSGQESTIADESEVKPNQDIKEITSSDQVMTTTDDNEVKANQDIKDINSSGQVMTTIDHSEVISNQDMKEISSSGPDLTTIDDIKVKTKKGMKEISTSGQESIIADDSKVKPNLDIKEIPSSDQAMTTTDDSEVKANQDMKGITSSGQESTIADVSEVKAVTEMIDLTTSGEESNIVAKDNNIETHINPESETKLESSTNDGQKENEHIVSAVEVSSVSDIKEKIISSNASIIADTDNNIINAESESILESSAKDDKKTMEHINGVEVKIVPDIKELSNSGQDSTMEGKDNCLISKENNVALDKELPKSETLVDNSLASGNVDKYVKDSDEYTISANKSSTQQVILNREAAAESRSEKSMQTIQNANEVETEEQNLNTNKKNGLLSVENENVEILECILDKDILSQGCDISEESQKHEKPAENIFKDTQISSCQEDKSENVCPPNLSRDEENDKVKKCADSVQTEILLPASDAKESKSNRTEDLQEQVYNQAGQNINAEDIVNEEAGSGEMNALKRFFGFAKRRISMKKSKPKIPLLNNSDKSSSLDTNSIEEVPTDENDHEKVGTFKELGNEILEIGSNSGRQIEKTNENITTEDPNQNLSEVIKENNCEDKNSNNNTNKSNVISDKIHSLIAHEEIAAVEVVKKKSDDILGTNGTDNQSADIQSGETVKLEMTMTQNEDNTTEFKTEINNGEIKESVLEEEKENHLEKSEDDQNEIYKPNKLGSEEIKNLNESEENYFIQSTNNASKNKADMKLEGTVPDSTQDMHAEVSNDNITEPLTGVLNKENEVKLEESMSEDENHVTGQEAAKDEGKPPSIVNNEIEEPMNLEAKPHENGKFEDVKQTESKTEEPGCDSNCETQATVPEIIKEDHEIKDMETNQSKEEPSNDLEEYFKLKAEAESMKKAKEHATMKEQSKEVAISSAKSSDKLNEKQNNLDDGNKLVKVVVNNNIDSLINKKEKKTDDNLAREKAKESPKSKKRMGSDLFSQIKSTVFSIQKSKSRSELRLGMQTSELAKSPSTAKVPEEPEKKKSVDEKQGYPHRETTKTNKEKTEKEKDPEPEALPFIASPLIKKRMLEQQREEAPPMKLDAIFAPIRSDSVDDMKTNIKIRGMGDINLKPQVIQKSSVDRNKMDQEYDKKRQARQQIAMPDKPVKFKKPKKKVKEVTPPPKEATPPPPKEPTPPPPRDPTPPIVTIREPTPPPPTPPPREPTPAREPTPEPVPQIQERLSGRLPPRLGINGFDRTGRLVLRALIEAGFSILAVNDPYIPVQQMVHALKHDISQQLPVKRGSRSKKAMDVRETTAGNLMINSQEVQVLREPVNIPWTRLGVNTVIETDLSCNSVPKAKLHLSNLHQGIKLSEAAEPDLIDLKDPDEDSGQDGFDDEALYYGVERVLIANPSPDAKSIALGVNDDDENIRSSVLSHSPASAAALATVLKILDDRFGVKYCSFTLLKASLDSRRDIRVPNLGPNAHASRAVRWDFKENLVPIDSTDVESEVLRILPEMRGKMTGLVMYCPVPQVSTIDLTMTAECESPNLFRDICLELKEAAESSHQGILKYVLKNTQENSASCSFTGSTESVAFDAKSSRQVSNNTVKLLLWFDQESGNAARVVDFVRRFHQIY